MEDQAYLTAGHPAVAARVKLVPGDFRVDELPAYEPCGRGDHVFLRIEKRGITTRAAIAAVAAALGVRAADIGCAGQKDARALATQYLSVEHVDPERVRALELPGLRVLAVERHGNKLRRGHLRGNRFALRLRSVEPGRAADLAAVLAELERRGVPSYFGPQRFGHRGDGAAIGLALLREDWERVCELVAGSPSALDTGAVLRARELFAARRFGESARAWPRAFGDCARLAHTLERSGGDAARAVRAIDRRAQTFFVSAWQSALFNRLVSERLRAGLGCELVHAGDVACVHASGGLFRVDEPTREAPRCAGFEISPTGPLPGPDVLRAGGVPGELEERVLGLVFADGALLARARSLHAHGSRRALRFRPEELALEAGQDELGSFLELRFRLAPGCFATSLLREVCKQGLSGVEARTELEVEG